MERINLRTVFDDFIEEFWKDHVEISEDRDEEYLVKLFYDKFNYVFNCYPPFYPDYIVGMWSLLDALKSNERQTEALIKMGVPKEYL